MSTDTTTTDSVNAPVLPTENPQPELVSRDAYESVKKDLFSLKDKVKDYETRIESMKINGHKEKEDWKEVARIHEEKAKDLETRYSGLKESLVREKKTSALVVEAQKHGINPASIADLELLDFDEISIETTSTGKILVSGADRAIAKLKILRPHWFTASVPSVNSSTPELRAPISGQVTTADLVAAENLYKKTRSDSDKQAYFDLIKKYKSQ